jgi:hypothetical protein
LGAKDELVSLELISPTGYQEICKLAAVKRPCWTYVSDAIMQCEMYRRIVILAEALLKRNSYGSHDEMQSGTEQVWNDGLEPRQYSGGWQENDSLKVRGSGWE